MSNKQLDNFDIEQGSTNYDYILYGNSTSLLVAQLLADEDIKQNKYEDERDSFFFDSDAFDLQGPEQSEQFGGIGVQSVAKFYINPSLSESSSSLLVTLNKRQLDFQAVRAEVMIMCFDQSINHILPTHVYLLGNGENDFNINPPLIKLMVHDLKKRKFRMAGKKHRRNVLIRNWFIFRYLEEEGRAFSRKRRGFFHYITMSQFYRWGILRLMAMTHDEMTIKPFSYTELLAKFRSEFGTFRTLQLRLLKS